MPDFSQTLVSLQNWLHTQPVSLERFLQHEKGQLRGWLKDHLTPLKQVDACNLLCLSIEQKIPERLYQRLHVQKLGVEFASRQQIQLFMQQRSIAESRATWAVLFWCAVLGEKVTVPSYPELKPHFSQLAEDIAKLVQVESENRQLHQELKSAQAELTEATSKVKAEPAPALKPKPKPLPSYSSILDSIDDLAYNLCELMGTRIGSFLLPQVCFLLACLLYWLEISPFGDKSFGGTYGFFLLFSSVPFFLMKNLVIVTESTGLFDFFKNIWSYFTWTIWQTIIYLSGVLGSIVGVFEIFGVNGFSNISSPSVVIVVASLCAGLVSIVCARMEHFGNW